MADQFVEPFALVAVDGRHGGGHGAPPLDRGTEEKPATRSGTAHVGTVSLASKACPSVPGPGALVASPGPFISCVARRRK
jgi:hypothetical protein